MVSIVSVSSLFQWSWVTVNCHSVQRRRSESIRRSRSASGATSALRPWLARSNTSSQRSRECSASRSSRSGVYDRTAISAGDPTTAIVWSTRVTLVAATTLVPATDKCFATCLLGQRGVHRKSRCLCSAFVSVGNKCRRHWQAAATTVTNVGDSSKAEACDDDG